MPETRAQSIFFVKSNGLRRVKACRQLGQGVPRMGAHALQPTATGKALYGASSPVLEGFLVVVIGRDVFGLDSKFEAYQTG